MEDVKEVVSRVIDEIAKGKDKLFNIIDNLRDEYDKEVQELNEITIRMEKIIHEVDTLERLDKQMRTTLARVSSDIRNVRDDEIKKVYEKALDVRVRYITKQEEEKNLKCKRDKIEQSLKRYLKNIEEANSTIKQVNVALGFIQGDIVEPLIGLEENVGMLMGIKILEAQENERGRIARDIHDGPAQYLANTIMRMDFCKMILTKDLYKGIRELEDLKENVKMALKEVRGILFDLRPLYLSDLTLKEAVGDLVEDLKDEKNIDCTLYMKDGTSELDTMVQIAVYRIIQEITTNIKKHSKATTASIRIEIGKEYVYFMVSDNGIGYDYEEVIKKAMVEKTSYGVISIFDRVNQLQGKIEIESAEDIGTTYKIRLPIGREINL